MPKLHVVYEDNHILVVIKPPNILSQGDDTGDPSMVDIVKQYLKDTYHKPGNVYLGLVHRLDRPVAGLLLLAKTSKAASRLSQALVNKEIRRSYFAIAEGDFSGGILEHNLLQDARGFIIAANKEDSQAKRAVLRASVIAQKENSTLCYVELATGRKHQIRAQFQLAGHPLRYDMRYGRGQAGKQIALYGASLSLLHPTTKEPLLFVSDPLQDAHINSFAPYKKELKKFLEALGEEHERSTGANHISFHKKEL